MVERLILLEFHPTLALGRFGEMTDFSKSHDQVIDLSNNYGLVIDFSNSGGLIEYLNYFCGFDSK